MVTLIPCRLKCALIPYIYREFKYALICAGGVFRWIESLNTVMDDNKILTLASNERIALTPTMRLLFEISNLRTATPATVSAISQSFCISTDKSHNTCGVCLL